MVNATHYDFSEIKNGWQDSGGYGKDIQAELRDANGNLIGVFPSRELAEHVTELLLKSDKKISRN